MIGLTVGVGVVIPPVAVCVFVVKNITKVPFNTIYKGVYPFLWRLSWSASCCLSSPNRDISAIDPV